MDDQLDNDLKKRIKEVFDNYDDPSADEGWLKLREKYPEKDKRRIAAWLWWAPAAALLLLFLGILWFRQTPEKHQQTAMVKKSAEHKNQAIIASKKENNASRNDSVTAPENARTIAGSNQNNKGTTNSIFSGAKKSAQSAYNNEGLAQNVNRSNNSNNRSSKAALTVGRAKNASRDNLTAKTGLAASSKVDDKPAVSPVSKNAGKISADTGAKTYAVTAAPGLDMKEEQAKKTVTPVPGINMQEEQAKKKEKEKDIFADDDNNYKKPKKKESDDKNKAVRFGVYAATYFNYAKGSSNQFNLGAGIASDIKLTENLDLSTGVSIGQNTLSYASQPPPAQTGTFAAAAPNSFSALGVSYTPTKLVYSPNSPAFKNYSADLVGLDIPLNLKFVIDPKKSRTYILAGVSSGTFINETYTYSYNNPSLFSADISQVQGQSTRNSFNGFYFAKTLNFAFGTGYLIGGNRLIVEPFLKYPLEGLGTQQIKFGAGGINLKFNFERQKK